MTSVRGPFITFEGGEGSGKSTQIVRLFQRLSDAGIDVVSYREPGGTPGAEEIRALLLQGDAGRWTPPSEALLMSAARADLIARQIRPQIEKGGWVLCDRFADSTIAYQGFGHGLGYERVEALNAFTVGDMIPDLTFIFQVDPVLGLERAAVRAGGHDRYERFDLAFHQRVAEGYAEILKRSPERCVAVEGAGDREEIAQFVFATVQARFLQNFNK